jgi:ketosteroid isomerase-like protein
MTKPLRLLLAALAAVLFVSPVAAQSQPHPRDVIDATRGFLDAYARGDAAAVDAVLADAVVVYGSDRAEVFRGKPAVRELLKADQQLWRGSATIGEISDLSIVEDGDFASLIFQAPFAVGGRPPMTVRFSMVWRRTPQGWRLVQSANTVPTVGQSAAELLKP